MCWKVVGKNIPQFGGEFNGDESHGRKYKKITLNKHKICTYVLLIYQHSLRFEEVNDLQHFKNCSDHRRGAFPDLLLLPAINAPLVVSQIWVPQAVRE